MDAVRAQHAHAEDGGPGGAGGGERAADRRVSSSASRSSAEPTIAGAAMSRIAAPVVRPNCSTTSWARVGLAEREMAPLSCTISDALVQPGRRWAATSSIVRPHETPIAPVGWSEVR